jgi:pimeloyl-ACP methyl ester carboxylesterase
MMTSSTRVVRGFVGLSLISLSFHLFVAPLAHADMKEFFFKRAQRAQAQQDSKKALLGAFDPFAIQPVQSIQPQTADPVPTSTDDLLYDQHIDHSNAEDMRTFKQRYWIDDSQATGLNAPVLFYICGEATCSSRDAGETVTDNAKLLGAYVITLEHRYYGKSQPFTSLTTDNLQYLTVANALADLAEFQKHIQTSLGWTGKWVSIGGSYPGALSAFYRAKYPDLVVGSLASSAPVQAQENFEEYDRHVTEVAGPACAALIRKAVVQTEAAVASPDALAAIKTLFAAEKITDSDDFLYLLADVGASAVQYGMRDQFCATLTAAGSDVNALLTNYGLFAQKVYKSWGIDAYGFSAESAENLDPDSYLSGFGQRQWLYQSCTEFGFFQNAYHDPAYSVRSARINPAYHRNLCERLFGFNKPVNTDEINQNFLKAVLEGSNILLSNGSQDPWSILSILPGSPLASQNANLQTYLVDQGSHCSDLVGATDHDSASLIQARQTFTDLATSWVGSSSQN